MAKSIAILLLLLVALVWIPRCGTAPTGGGPLPAGVNQLTPEESAAGWLLLFDGISLDGWEDPTLETPPGDSWMVEDGCIKAVGHPRLREDLLTHEVFGDFELAFEWRISPGGNSGVKYRIQDRAVLVAGHTNPEARRFEDTVEYELQNRTADRGRLGPQDRIEEYLVAFEFQVIDNDGHPDAAQDLDRRAGAIYGLVAPSDAAVRPVGEFNTSRILLRGNHVEHWLNGRKILEADLGSQEIAGGLERRWTSDSEVYRALVLEPRVRTPIALQNHGDDAWFRNLKIRPLE